MIAHFRTPHVVGTLDGLSVHHTRSNTSIFYQYGEILSLELDSPEIQRADPPLLGGNGAPSDAAPGMPAVGRRQGGDTRFVPRTLVRVRTVYGDLLFGHDRQSPQVRQLLSPAVTHLRAGQHVASAQRGSFAAADLGSRLRMLAEVTKAGHLTAAEFEVATARVTCDSR